MFICDKVWLKGEIHSPLACSTVTLRTLSASNMPMSGHTLLIHKLLMFLLEFDKTLKKKNLNFTVVIITHWWVAHKDFPCTEHLTTTLPTLRKNLSLAIWADCQTFYGLCFMDINYISGKTKLQSISTHFQLAFSTPPVLIKGKWTSAQSQYFNY